MEFSMVSWELISLLVDQQLKKMIKKYNIKMKACWDLVLWVLLLK